jgi:hypothetical protein
MKRGTGRKERYGRMSENNKHKNADLPKVTQYISAASADRRR